MGAVIDKIIKAAGNSVLIVGNADYIKRRDWSQQIDSFPCVVRFNHGVPRKNAGSKFTVLVMGICNPYEQHMLWQSLEKEPDFVMHLHPCVPMLTEYQSKLCRQTEREYNTFRAAFDAEPSSGAMAIDWFLRNTTANIHILGFDGMRTKSFYHDKQIALTSHSSNHEQRYISNVIRQGLVRSIG